MEKIPYKPGDVLVDKYQNHRIVIDLSNNQEAVFLSSLDGTSIAETYTKGMLDICGYTLKTPKEETPTLWRPRNYQIYYFLTDLGIPLECNWWDGDEVNNYRLKSGNCFRTRKEAEKKYKEIMSRPI